MADDNATRLDVTATTGGKATVETLVPAKTPEPPAAKTPVRIGVAPTNLDEGWRLAQMMAKSELVPKSFRNKPEDVLVAIQMGVEIGFAPMQALQSIAVVNGRPSVWGDGFLALIMASPLYLDHDEYYEVADGAAGAMVRRAGLIAADLSRDTTVAVCTFWRKGKPQPVTRRFTVGQAKKAKLLDKHDTPWQTYPDRMLAMRARSWAGRDAFPDLLRGIRTAEEAIDDPTPVVDVRQVQRLSAARTSTDSLLGTSAAPADDVSAAGSAPSDLDHTHVCRGGHEYACAEHKCAGTRALDCAEHPTTGEVLTAEQIPFGLGR